MLRAIFIFIALLIFSCSPKVEVTKKGEVKGDIRGCLDDAPKWVHGPYNYVQKDKYIFLSLGKFPCVNLLPSECIDPAIHNAKAKLASSVAERVRRAVKYTVKTFGISRAKYEEYSDAVVQTMLMGVRHIDTWVSPCKEVYVLVGIERSYAPVIAKIATNYLNQDIYGFSFNSEREKEEFVDMLIEALMGR